MVFGDKHGGGAMILSRDPKIPGGLGGRETSDVHDYHKGHRSMQGDRTPGPPRTAAPK